jgi:hypothetical protein
VPPFDSIAARRGLRFNEFLKVLRGPDESVVGNRNRHRAARRIHQQVTSRIDAAETLRGDQRLVERMVV